VIAIALLVVNDRLLKGTGPEWLTGKLSDVTGVFVFPLAATALVDLVGFALFKLGIKTDFTLRRWKLAVAMVFTAIVFASIKLSPAIAAQVERLWAAVIPGAEIYPDPTDVICLVMLAATWWHGRRAIARGAYGRLALAKPDYDDAVACGADPAVVRELEAAVTAWRAGSSGAPVDAALARLRERRSSR
jgi:hypothetical protein